MRKENTVFFPAPIRAVEGITEYKLTNGLTILLFPDTSTQNVTVNMTYLVGSRHEGRGEAGMAHLLEHMLFKGTPTHPDIDTIFHRCGASHNGTTSFDRTNYFETFPANDENLELILKLEADRMINSWIRQVDLDTEMTVVRNEFEMGKNNPIRVLHDQILAAAYQWHNYGKTTIGNRSDIERVPIKNLNAFYQHYYQPDNAILIVAGNFKIPKIQELILHYFGTLPKPSRLLDNTYTEEPTQEGPRAVKLLRVADLAQTAVAYHIPAASHPDFAPLLVLSELLTSEPSGLLYQSLIETGIASELFTITYALKEPGLFMIFAQPTHNEQVAETRDNLLKQLENLNENHIIPDNVERAKKSLLKKIKISMKNSHDFALELSESIAQGDYRLFFYTRDQIKTITADDILRVTTSYFVESNRTTGLFIPITEPQRAIIPSTPDVERLLDGYCGSEDIHLGEAFSATTENIDAHTSRMVLSDTIKIALLPKSTRGRINQARLIFHFGDEGSLYGKYEILRLIPHLLHRGTKNLTFQQVQDTLDKLQSSLSIYPGPAGIASVDITSDHDHLPEVITLAAELIRTPRFSQEEFAIIHKRKLAHLKATRTDPMKIGMLELDRLKNPFSSDSIHYLPTIDERIKALKAVSFENVQQVYTDLYGANHLEIAIIGDFDPGITATIESVLGNWPSPLPYHRIKTPFIPALGELHTLPTPDKPMAIVAMGANFAMRDDDMHCPAIIMANYIFGGSMKSRLRQRLREQEGLSYGVKSFLSISQYDPSAEITFYAMCATNKADLALELLQEEYRLWLDQGVTEQELLESKQSYQLYFNNLLASDSFVVRTLGSLLHINRNFGYYAQLLKQIQLLRAEDIHKALEIFLHSAPLAKVKAGDFKLE